MSRVKALVDMVAGGSVVGGDGEWRRSEGSRPQR